MLLALLAWLGGCAEEGTIVIDVRRDGGGVVPDAAPVLDGGAPMDAPGVDDAGVDAGGGDAGCTRETPPAPMPWTPVDTGGPAGESVSACLARVGSRTDDRKPWDQGYDLTTFGGPGDEQPVACAGAPMADGTWYYAANRQRFTCGQRVRLVDEARTACVIVEVADVGPNACVEEAGGRAVWDVSPLASQGLFGVSSAGWSEHRAVRGAPVASGNALGPCDHVADPSRALRGYIGGACASAADCTFAGAACLGAADGFPGGHCTQDCAGGSCPDAAGPNAYTACATLPGAGDRCVARCDFTLFATGCRDGYGCFDSPHPTSGAIRQVCLPLECRP